jgi:hypothetical protein
MRGGEGGLALLFRLHLIRSSARQHIAAITIATFHRAAFIHLQPDARMAKGGRHAVTAAITGDAVGADKDGFRSVYHDSAVSKARAALQPAALALASRKIRSDRPGAGIDARQLRCIHHQFRTDIEFEKPVAHPIDLIIARIGSQELRG